MDEELSELYLWELVWDTDLAEKKNGERHRLLGISVTVPKANGDNDHPKI